VELERGCIRADIAASMNTSRSKLKSNSDGSSRPEALVNATTDPSSQIVGS